MEETRSIPTDRLPDGWIRGDGALTFWYPGARLSLCAVRRTAHSVPSTLGLDAVWDVAYARRIGETTDREAVETVTTRGDAVEWLCACMKGVTKLTGRVDETVHLSALADVSKRGTPDRPPTADTEVVDEVSYARSWSERLERDERE